MIVGPPDPPPPISWGSSRYPEVDGERMGVIERGSAGPRLAMRFPLLAHLAVTRAQGVAARAAGVTPIELARGGKTNAAA